MKTLVLKEKITVMYIEYTKLPDDILNGELKVETVETVADAARLEREVLWRWADMHKKYDGVGPPFPVESGSITMQLLTMLIFQTGNGTVEERSCPRRSTSLTATPASKVGGRSSPETF